MKNTYVFVLALFFSCTLISQAPEWVVAVGVEINYSKTDTQGNIYGVGVFKGTVDFDPSTAVFNLQTSSSYNNVFIVKYDNSGNFVWAKSLGNSANDECVFDLEIYNDELYVMGEFDGTVDFDFSSNENSITGNEDVFVAKYNSDADLIWVGAAVGTFVVINDNRIHLDLAINNFDSSLYISGNFYGIADFDLTTSVLNKDAGVGRDVFLAKYNLNGELLWCKTSGNNSSSASLNAIAFDTNGNVYGAGYSSGQNFDIDLGNSEYLISTNYYSFMFVAKYNNNGDFINVIEVNHTNVETWSLSIRLGANDKVFVSGKSGYFVFGNFYSSNQIRAFDSSLNLLWDVNIQGSNSNGYPTSITNLETTSASDVIYCGSISVSGQSTRMPFLSKYDSNGTSLFLNSDLQENDTFTHNQAEIIEGYGGLSSLSTFSDDSFVIFGNLTHTGPLPYIGIDLDISQEGEHYIDIDNTYPNNALYFMAKYNDFTLSTPDYSLQNSLLKISPNPTNSKIYLTSTLLENNGQILIYDLLGKVVYNKQVYSPLNNYQIDIESLESGIYYVKYKTNSNSLIKKIIKN